MWEAAASVLVRECREGRGMSNAKLMNYLQRRRDGWWWRV